MRNCKSENYLYRGNLIYSSENSEITLGKIPCVYKKIENKRIFERECYVFLNSNHVNILKHFKIFHINQIIAMEPCEYSLFNRIHDTTKRKIPDKIKLKYIKEIVDGMIYLHETLKVLHRDIKPSNCLLSCNCIIISDFGHSHKIENFNKKELYGTANYILPDILKDKDIDNPKVIDIYAFGLLVWELYTNKIPFEKLKSFGILHLLKNSTCEVVVDLEIVKNLDIRKLIGDCLQKKYDSFIGIKFFLHGITK